MIPELAPLTESHVGVCPADGVSDQSLQWGEGLITEYALQMESHVGVGVLVES